MARKLGLALAATLVALLLGELAADRGDIEGLQGMRLAHMAQEVHATELPAGEYVWRPGGSRHDARAPQGALVLSMFLKPNRFL